MNELKQAVTEYLQAIAKVSVVGTPELSHYTALDNLFDAIGEQLSPKVRAVVHYSETAGGQPDLGFFSGDNTDPDRGVVEVKGADADLDELIASPPGRPLGAEQMAGVSGVEGFRKVL